jgi:cytoskeletal protein CcmA (bactofilin family)
MGILGSKKPTTEMVAPAPAGLSIIAVGLTVRGDLDSNGTVKVEGAVEGHVSTRAQVLVAKGGEVHGDVDALEAIVGGTITGAIRATERVEIQSGAVVNGDVTTRRIMVAEGGSLNGQVRMGEGALQERPAAGKGDPPRPNAGAVTPIPPRPSVPIARVAVPPRQPTS